jgi:hypothetical protein
MRTVVEQKRWPLLADSDHYPTLKRLLDIAVSDGCKTLIDVGCGAASLQQLPFVQSCFSTTGVDFPHIIEGAALPLYPNGCFIRCDLLDEKTDLSFLKKYDLVVMNAFIDVMQYPLIMLDRILRHCTSHVLLHRQYVTDKPTFLSKHESYGGESYSSHINEKELDDVLKRNKVGIKRIRLDTNLGWPGMYSFLWEVNT